MLRIANINSSVQIFFNNKNLLIKTHKKPFFSNLLFWYFINKDHWWGLRSETKLLKVCNLLSYYFWTLKPSINKNIVWNILKYSLKWKILTKACGMYILGCSLFAFTNRTWLDFNSHDEIITSASVVFWIFSLSSSFCFFSFWNCAPDWFDRRQRNSGTIHEYSGSYLMDV